VWVKEFEGVVENNQVTQFQVIVKLSFLVGEGAGADQVNPAMEDRMAQTRGPSTNPQRGSGANQGKGTEEGGGRASRRSRARCCREYVQACAGYLRDRRALRA
jgi:hypothetical protein